MSQKTIQDSNSYIVRKGLERKG